VNLTYVKQTDTILGQGFLGSDRVQAEEVSEPGRLPCPALLLSIRARLMNMFHIAGRAGWDPSSTAFLQGSAMNDIDLFLELPLTVQAAVVCFVACATGLFVVLLAAPRQDCFFLHWRPEVRLLALLVSPALLIVWPIVLYAMFLKSRGIGPDAPDYFEDD
jgi:hypothetical protein